MINIKKLPNNLTKIRLYAIPFLVLFVLFFNQHIISRTVGVGIFIIVAFTDYFDGYFARKYKIESAFGRCFDNIADKALVISLLFVLVSQSRADVLPCIAIALRELIISGVREFLGNKQISLPVSVLAKWKTTLQLVAVGILLAATKYGFLHNLGLAVLWVSAIVAIITMRDYINGVSSHL